MQIEAKDISIAFGDAVILDTVSLSVPEKSSVALSGVSGAGKSTLLAIMGLLLEPTSGQIIVDGVDVLHQSEDFRSDTRNQAFGFVFQSTQLISSLRAIENVLIPSLLAGKRAQDSRAKELLCEMGLEDKMNHYPHQLSVGQQRRVSLARALIMEPKIVFADEPTNDLDPQNASIVGDILYALPQKGCSLVVVTHDEELASRADYSYSIEDAKIKKRTVESLA